MQKAVSKLLAVPATSPQPGYSSCGSEPDRWNSEKSRGLQTCTYLSGLSASSLFKGTEEPNQRKGNTKSPCKNFIAIVALHLCRLFVEILNSVYPEFKLPYSIELIRVILVRYCHECTLPKVGSDHFLTYAERMVYSMAFVPANPNTKRLPGLQCRSSSEEEFQASPKIIPTENDIDYNEQWGHFADFDTIEGKDVIFPASRYYTMTDHFE